MWRYFVTRVAVINADEYSPERLDLQACYVQKYLQSIEQNQHVSVQLVYILVVAF